MIRIVMQKCEWKIILNAKIIWTNMTHWIFILVMLRPIEKSDVSIENALKTKRKTYSQTWDNNHLWIATNCL